MSSAPAFGSTPDARPKKVVICGGGIIGAATSYYLSQLGVAAIVVEKESPACAASGKAGGFLALDWNDSSPIGPLARASFALHQQLADTLGKDVGYRRVNTLQVASTEKPGSGRVRKGGQPPAWLDGNVLGTSVLGGPDSTAQVHPFLLTNALLDAAAGRGASVLKGEVQGLQMSDAKQLTGVIVDGQVVPADVAVIAMGPWSDLARQWVSLPQITAQKAHSIVLKPAGPVTDHCLFTAFTYASGRKVDPEVYPRGDGTVYVCGEALDPGHVEEAPGKVQAKPELCENLRVMAASLSSSLGQAEVQIRQACHLPLTPDGQPVIGPVPGAGGVYVATGHSCWGILNGPATGRAMAELIVHGKSTSVDLAPFSAERFMLAGAGRRR